MRFVPIQAKSLLSSSKNPDPWFGIKYNCNLYRGCQHHCIYCDSRSECYQLDTFDTEIRYKENAIEMLDKTLRGKKIKGTIGLGAMNDPYMPIEKELELTRKALEVIAKHKFPVHIITKSDLVLRDLDLLKKISKTYAAVSFSITTCDDRLSKKVEPGASLSSKRFRAMRKLSRNGIYTGVTMMPILPYLEDSPENVRGLVELAIENGAKYIIPALGVTMRDRQRDYFYKQLDRLFPRIKEKYKKSFGNRYDCSPVNASYLRGMVFGMMQKYNIPKKMKIFKPVEVAKEGQRRLF